LREFTGRQAKVALEISPKTVDEALKALCARYPGIRDRMATEQGEFRQHISVFVGSEDIRYTGGLATPTADGCEISIVPAVSGGAVHLMILPQTAAACATLTTSIARRVRRRLPQQGRPVEQRMNPDGFQPRKQPATPTRGSALTMLPGGRHHLESARPKEATLTSAAAP